MADMQTISRICDITRTEDFKKEKHVPVIELPERCVAGQPMILKVMVGKDIQHPNTTEHHIQWISLQYKPDDDLYSYELGIQHFNSHGGSVKGANQGPAYSHPQAIFDVTLHKPGTLIALESCNIHGLWESSLRVDFHQ